MARLSRRPLAAEDEGGAVEVLGRRSERDGMPREMEALAEQLGAVFGRGGGWC
jgi:hypothetical protein